MKVAFPTSGDTLDAVLDTRFGRAPGFLVFDEEGDSIEIVDNRESAEAVQGAGIQAADAVIRSGARVVVAAQCGPGALRVLEAAGVEVFLSDARRLSDALASLRAGTLKRAEAARAGGGRP